MKKEIPKMLRSAAIVYAFDFLGTVFSTSKSFLFPKLKMEFNPDQLGIRWVLIVPDSWFYLKLAQYWCWKTGLKPAQVIRCPNWKANTENVDAIRGLLSKICKHESVLTYIDPIKVKKVIYINNNLKLDDRLNETIDRFDLNLVAMNLIDFWQKKFDHLM